ncbi:MAG: ABC transporter permease subunit, partial [Clostridia bacterium]
FRCMSVSHRIHAIRVATKREIRSTLHGIGLYVVLSLVFLVASYVFANTVLRNVGDAGILALPNPVTLPLIVSTGLAAAYLGLCSSLSISRDRDLGTMEVLFYGPVDAVAYVLGKYFHQLAAYGVVLAFTLVNFYGLSVVTNVGFSLEIAGIMLLSVFLTSCMVSFGIVLSAGSRRMMVSVILFLGFVLFFLIFSLVHAWVIGAAGRDAASTMVYVRMIMDSLDQVIRWISPVEYYLRGMDAVLRKDTSGYIMSAVSSLLYSAALLAVSVWMLRKKGVRR